MTKAIKTIKNIIIILGLIIIGFGCSSTSPETKNNSLTINFIVESGISVITKNITLRSETDHSLIYTGNRQNNKIEYINLPNDTFSIIVGEKEYKDQIDFFSNKMTKNISLDTSEYSTVVFQNHTFGYINEIIMICENDDDGFITETYTYFRLTELGSQGSFAGLDIYSYGAIKHIVTIGGDAIFSMRNVDLNNVVDIKYDSRPNVLIVFCSETIAATIGEIIVRENEEGIIQIGIDSFDAIAREFQIYDLIQNRKRDMGAHWTLPAILPGPDNRPEQVFGILRRAPKYGLVDALQNDESIIAAQSVIWIDN